MIIGGSSSAFFDVGMAAKPQLFTIARGTGRSTWVGNVCQEETDLIGSQSYGERIQTGAIFRIDGDSGVHRVRRNRISYRAREARPNE
jgi:hypothetical protein